MSNDLVQLVNFLINVALIVMVVIAVSTSIKRSKKMLELSERSAKAIEGVEKHLKELVSKK